MTPDSSPGQRPMACQIVCKAFEAFDRLLAVLKLLVRAGLKFLVRKEPSELKLHWNRWAAGRKRLLASAKESNCFDPQKEAIASFHKKKQLLPYAEGSNCFLPRKEEIASIQRRKQLLPSAEGSNFFPPWKEATASFRTRKQFHPHQPLDDSWTLVPVPSRYLKISDK